MHIISKNAFFIADAHENDTRTFFWDFLSLIEDKKLNPSSLFLMGDIFDLLAWDIKSTHKFAQKYIDKLEFLAERFPIYYFEGNHDFNLKPFFHKVKVFSIKQQPQIFKSNCGDVLLLHGDKFGSLTYKVYTFLIRNKFICKMLDLIDKILHEGITKAILKQQKEKNICKIEDNFKKNKIKQLKKYPIKNIKFIFEGHHHQGINFCWQKIRYYNFSSFACDKSYFVVQSDESMKITQQNIKGKNGNYV